MHNTHIQTIKITLHYTIRSIQIIQSQPHHTCQHLYCVWMKELLNTKNFTMKRFTSPLFKIPSFLNFFCLIVIFVKNLK